MRVFFSLRPFYFVSFFVGAGLLAGCAKVYWREGPCDTKSGKPEMRFDFSGGLKKAERQKDIETASCEQNRLKIERKDREKNAHLSEIYPRLQPLPQPSEALELLEGKIDRHFYSEDGGLLEIKNCSEGKCAPEDSRRKINPNLYEVYNGSQNDSFSILYKDASKSAFENCPSGQYAYWNIQIERYATPFGDMQKAPALVRLGCTANWSDPFAAPETEERVSVQNLSLSRVPYLSGDSSAKALPQPQHPSSEPEPVISPHIQSFFPDSAKPTLHNKRANNLYKDLRPEE
ncbi:hypothetical protein FAI41_05725 [Acetobacteraceae bacterium]|nr:hypothetical protein FAI41_05725 [Acetobacteraceae bacterium]